MPSLALAEEASVVSDLSNVSVPEQPTRSRIHGGSGNIKESTLSLILINQNNIIKISKDIFEKEEVLANILEIF